jgi:hypothetical protein
MYGGLGGFLIGVSLWLAGVWSAWWMLWSLVIGLAVEVCARIANPFEVGDAVAEAWHDMAGDYGSSDSGGGDSGSSSGGD